MAKSINKSISKECVWPHSKHQAKRVLNTTHSRVFLTNFEVFENVVTVLSGLLLLEDPPAAEKNL